MSFGKLLASGKSFVSGRNKPAYREIKRVLPKFGSPKNPFASVQTIQTELPEVEIKQSLPAQEKPASLPKISGPTKSLASWTRKLNPVSVWRDAKENSQEISRSISRPVIQAELSLDTVKVVHNDLTDADVEVVPMKSRSASAPELQPAKKSWEILGERLMRATAL